MAAAVLGALVGAASLLVLTQLGLGFVVGTLPDAWSVAAARSLAIGSVLLAAGPVAVELVRPRLERLDRPIPRTFDRGRGAILAIFLLSGAAGLVYEVVWARQLVLVFGNTTQAISAILTGYFGGIAIGSVIGGRIADRVRRPLRLYGLLELVLVVIVLVTPLLFRGLHELYRSGYATLAGTPTLLQLIRYGLALLALAPATVLMGATLPTLSRHLARNRGELGRSFGSLYAANTVGAVIGTLVAGLLLIEIVGLTLTLVIGAAGSATAGLAALALNRRRASDTEPVIVVEPEMPSAAEAVLETAALHVPPAVVPESARRDAVADLEVASDPWLHRVAIALAFVSGATSLGYQLLWTRLLASGSGNTTYVFTLILSIFLIGIAIGAALISRRMQRSVAAVATLGSIQLLIAALVVAGTVILSGQASGIDFVPRVILSVLPATLALGATLPLASSLRRHRRGPDRTGHRAAPRGQHDRRDRGEPSWSRSCSSPPSARSRSVLLLALINVVTGLYLLARGKDLSALARRALTVAGGGLAAVAVIALVVPNPLMIDPGATRLARNGALLASAEDEIAAVQAGGVGASRQLLVGGTGNDPAEGRCQADDLPAADDPTGRTPAAGDLLRDGLRLPIRPPRGTRRRWRRAGPVGAGHAPWFYSDADRVLADPRGKLSITDGRNFVELSSDRYDLITVDPPPPIESSGTSVLYSREFYEASARPAHRGWRDDGVDAGVAVGRRIPVPRSHVQERLPERAPGVQPAPAGRLHARVERADQRGPGERPDDPRASRGPRGPGRHARQRADHPRSMGSRDRAPALDHGDAGRRIRREGPAHPRRPTRDRVLPAQAPGRSTIAADDRAEPAGSHAARLSSGPGRVLTVAGPRP